ncbi:MAG TPA: DUF1707 domain-containing protein [Streptosporangiaceae bacterium]
MATGTDWRASDAERAAVADQLREHYALGRISMDEFRARLDAAYAAVTVRDLAPVTADLPAAATGQAGPLRPYPARARRRRRWAALLGVLALAAAITGSAVLIGSLPHGGLLVLVFLLVVLPVLALATLAATLVWVGRRAWRSGAWLELVPVAAGVPWLGRVIWLARAVLVSRAFWRLGRRVARPLRGRRARSAGRYPGYQRPGGPWAQPRVGDLSGTTR